MTVYVMAQLTFVDRATYDRYQARFMDVLRPFGGTLLVADERPRVLEGDSTCDKAVLIRFPDESTFRTWSTSPEYQEILKDRKAGARATVLLMRGLNPAREFSDQA